MDKQALDRYITTEPDNGYQDWVEQIWGNHIPESEISGDEYDENMKFFDDGMNELALAGTNNGRVSMSFAALVLIRSFQCLKKHPELKTWEAVREYLKTQ